MVQSPGPPLTPAAATGDAGSIPAASTRKVRCEGAREVALCRKKACAGVRTVAHEKPAICDRFPLVGSRSGRSGAGDGSHATHGCPAARTGAVVRRVVPHVAGQDPLFVMPAQRPESRRRIHRRIATPEDFAAFCLAYEAAGEIRGNLTPAERWCPGGCGKAILRERRVVRSTLVRLATAVVGIVLPIGRRRRSGRLLQPLRNGSEGPSGRADVYGRGLVVGSLPMHACARGEVLRPARLSCPSVGSRGSASAVVCSSSWHAESGAN